ncbi:MAG: hypothetical protein ACXVJE_23360 [Mucilaginibacter sp.]
MSVKRWRDQIAKEAKQTLKVEPYAGKGLCAPPFDRLGDSRLKPIIFN